VFKVNPLEYTFINDAAGVVFDPTALTINVLIAFASEPVVYPAKYEDVKAPETEQLNVENKAPLSVFKTIFPVPFVNVVTLNVVTLGTKADVLHTLLVLFVTDVIG
jgi:hypothetical protein